jgi:hypothetical protein
MISEILKRFLGGSVETNIRKEKLFKLKNNISMYAIYSLREDEPIIKSAVDEYLNNDSISWEVACSAMVMALKIKN